MPATHSPTRPRADVRTKLPSASPAGPRRRTGERHRSEGQGRRLLEALESLDTFPVLLEARERLLSALAREHVLASEVITAIESDVALTVAVLRLANDSAEASGGAQSIVASVALLAPIELRTLAWRLPTFEFFQHAGAWGSTPESFRLHAVATQHVAGRLAVEVECENRDRLAVTSLLHDIGKLVLTRAYPGYPSHIHRQASTPEERIHQERRELGVDHALLGGALLGRWELPSALARPIESHHSPDAAGEAALIRLADMLAHYGHGAPVSPGEMLTTARAIGLTPEGLRRIMFEMPGPTGERQRHADPCPLSRRELGVLQRLSEGKVYKQIARELTLSTSTVRTHLHNIYGKLGAVDRAQAVLIAAQHGWL
jgi:HD-like signal output (HDOD) protein/DNA-binding CsgD family transcriptional regulator